MQGGGGGQEEGGREGGDGARHNPNFQTEESCRAEVPKNLCKTSQKTNIL